MAKRYVWPKGVKIVGYDQFHNVMFRVKDRGADLGELFFKRHTLQDQYWISISVPKNDEDSWDQLEAKRLEQKIVEDFEWDDYKVAIELEHGTGFPRSYPLTWFFSLSYAQGDEIH